MSEERAELFVFGEQRSYKDPYDHFYLIDLSFLPDASVAEPTAPPPDRMMTAPSGEPERRKSEASTGAKESEARQPPEATASPQRSHPPAAPARARRGALPPPPSNNLPSPGRIVMEAGVGKAYNLPERSRLRENAFDDARTSGDAR